jgi:hypothetical protein
LKYGYEEKIYIERQMMIHESLMVLTPINENENDGMAGHVMRRGT